MAHEPQPLVYADAIDEADHVPDSQSGDHWQESYACAWYDPVVRIGGWQHLSFKRARKILDYTSYVTIENKLVHNFQNPNYPMPDQPVMSFDDGPVSIRGLEPMKSHRLGIHDEKISCDLEVRSFIDAFNFTHNNAPQHWESYNITTGTVRYEGREYEINALTFLNRSWGWRDLSLIHTYRAVWACFGEEFSIRMLAITTAAGVEHRGFVLRDGKTFPLRDFTLRVTLASDGLTPLEIEAQAWTYAGDGYHIKGTIDGCAPASPVEGFTYVHAKVAYSCGGRLGTGFMEVAPLNALSAAQRAIVGRE